MKKDPLYLILGGQCAGPGTCPLSQVEPGTTVCIKQLAAAPELTERLRELGFCERQRIKLVSRNSNYICQVCNARLGISEKVAEAIIVEAVVSEKEGLVVRGRPGKKAAGVSAAMRKATRSSSTGVPVPVSAPVGVSVSGGEELECGR